MKLNERGFVLLAAVAIDLLLGDPPDSLHPVAWLGAVIDRLERRAPDADRAGGLRYGAGATAGLAVATAAAAWLAARAIAGSPRPVRILGMAILLKPTFALRGLLTAGSAVRVALEADDLPAARRALQSLVSRGRQSLSSEECAAAAVESLAENTADGFAGPWLAFAGFGLPGAWVFRCVNTLDSRWGYRGRYEWLGRTAAVLDDVCAAVPARLSALALVAGASLSGDSVHGAIQTLLRDRARTPSPNAGWTMATMAGALGRRLAKPGEYVLNTEGRPCDASDIARAQRLVLVSAGLWLTALLLMADRARPRELSES